jgi:hypothetical protein
MKTEKLAQAIILLVSLSVGCGGGQTLPPSAAGTAASAQAMPGGKKLGYGFEPGLVAGKDYVAGQLIVGYKPGTDTQALVKLAKDMGSQSATDTQSSALLLQFGTEQEVAAAVQVLRARPDVVFVERNGLMQAPPPPVLPDFKKRRY